MHHALFNSSSDIIVKLSTHWEILEFNPEAEKFFGIKREEAVRQNFIQKFITDTAKKKSEKDMNKLLNQALECKFIMEVIAAEKKKITVEWDIYILRNNLENATGMILMLKKLKSQEEGSLKI